MTHEEIVTSIKWILNKEIDGLKIKYFPETELTDAELIINDNINIQFCKDGNFWLGLFDGESFTDFGHTHERYVLVDFVKGILEKVKV